MVSAGGDFDIQLLELPMMQQGMRPFSVTELVTMVTLVSVTLLDGSRRLIELFEPVRAGPNR